MSRQQVLAGHFIWGKPRPPFGLCIARYRYWACLLSPQPCGCIAVLRCYFRLLPLLPRLVDFRRRRHSVSFAMMSIHVRKMTHIHTESSVSLAHTALLVQDHIVFPPVEYLPLARVARYP